MGNSQGTKRVHSKQTVTVVKVDGGVLEFSRSIRVSDLTAVYPNHFVCHSSALVLMQQGKMLSSSEHLLRGEIYFLLPLSGGEAAHPSEANDIHAPLLSSIPPTEAPSGKTTIKFVISKQQLAKILAEGSIKVAGGCSLNDSGMPARTPGLRVLHNPAPSVPKRSVTWSPGLESISEVAAK